VNPHEFYDSLSKQGMCYGSSFRLVDHASVSMDHTSIVSDIRIPSQNMQSSFSLPPELIDSLYQSALISGLGIESGIDVHKLTTVDRVIVRDRGDVNDLWRSETCLGIVTIKSRDDDVIVFDCAILSYTGYCVMVCEGVHLRRTSRSDYFNANLKTMNTLELESEWTEVSLVPEDSTSSIVLESALVISSS